MGLKDKENVSVDMELKGIIPARLSPLKLLERSIRKEQECKYHPNNSSFWFSWNCLQRKTLANSPPALAGSPSIRNKTQRSTAVLWDCLQSEMLVYLLIGQQGCQQGRSCGCHTCRTLSGVSGSLCPASSLPQTIITIPNKFLILSQQHPSRRLVRHPGVMFYL